MSFVLRLRSPFIHFSWYPFSLLNLSSQAGRAASLITPRSLHAILAQSLHPDLGLHSRCPVPSPASSAYSTLVACLASITLSSDRPLNLRHAPGQSSSRKTMSCGLSRTALFHRPLGLNNPFKQMLKSTQVKSDNFDQQRGMQTLEEEILSYLYILNRKYGVDSVPLARLCYRMERHVRAVKPAVVILLARGFLNIHHQGDRASCAISRKGIDFVENMGLVKIRDWVVEA